MKEIENDIGDEKNLLRKSALDKLEGASEESLLGQASHLYREKTDINFTYTIFIFLVLLITFLSCFFIFKAFILA